MAKTVWDYLTEELEFSERIIRDGSEVTPRFRVFTQGAMFRVFAPLQPRLDHQVKMLRLVRLFMTAKMAQAFIMCSELITPDAITVAAVGRNQFQGMIRMITREPLEFAQPLSLTRDHVGDEIFGLLPTKQSKITRDELEDLNQALLTGELHAFGI